VLLATRAFSRQSHTASVHCTSPEDCRGGGGWGGRSVSECECLCGTGLAVLSLAWSHALMLCYLPGRADPDGGQVHTVRRKLSVTASVKRV
jgi:hypothetical protein